MATRSHCVLYWWQNNKALGSGEPRRERQGAAKIVNAPGEGVTEPVARGGVRGTLRAGEILKKEGWFSKGPKNGGLVYESYRSQRKPKKGMEYGYAA
jgi:hypothetical protein